MRRTYFLMLSTLFLSALAGKFYESPIHPRHKAHSRVARATNANITSRVFVLQDFYQGQSFFDDFDFFSDADPTNGLVNYQTRENAIAKKLAYIEGGSMVLSVDSFSALPFGSNRDSVRISSKKTYTGGLFIADFFTMPHGCSIWPAYWSVGPDWPSGGEIDVLEGVHEGPTNSYTLHTSAGCSMTQLSNPSIASNFKSLSKLVNPTCESSGADNRGCGFSDPDPLSYGSLFNINVGGVFAHLWDNNGIRIWRFLRSNIPMDIVDRAPNPNLWGTPAAFFPSGDSCDMVTHFFDHNLVIDTTLCGDLAGPTFSGAGCPGTCDQAVADPSNFKFAQWRINYLSVYQ